METIRGRTECNGVTVRLDRRYEVVVGFTFLFYDGLLTFA